MKGLFISLGIVTAMSLVSCDETARLAKELPGTWAGTPENITDNSALTASVIESFEIVSDPSAVPEGKNGGLINVVGMLSATTQLVGDQSFSEPVGLTASARSSISGTWVVIDDDEVALQLDPATLKIEIDPDAIVTNNNLLNSEGTAKIASMKPTIAESMAAGMRQALSTRYSSFRHLDDVKVKEPLLKFEIGKTDYVFTRQGKLK